MIQYFNRLLPFFSGVLAFLFSVSCNEPNTAGLVVLPPGDLLQAGIDKSVQQTVLEALVEITDFPEFILDIARVDFFLVVAEGGGGIVFIFQRFKNGFGGKHAALHRQVHALQAL